MNGEIRQTADWMPCHHGVQVPINKSSGTHRGPNGGVGWRRQGPILWPIRAGVALSASGRFSHAEGRLQTKSVGHTLFGGGSRGHGTITFGF